MNRFEDLKVRNPHLSFFRVTDSEFLEYGYVIEDFDTVPLTLAVLTELERPKVGSRYLPAVSCLDAGRDAEEIRRRFGGQMDMQIGLCHGHNDRLQAMEWHRSSEFNIAVTDMVLFLGNLRDMEKEGQYDSRRVKAFYMEANQMVELYGTTLHYCPCQVDGQGFSGIVILPRGTNTPLDKQEEQKEFLWARNKWLVCHKNHTNLIEKGCMPGIYGENWNVNQLI